MTINQFNEQCERDAPKRISCKRYNALNETQKARVWSYYIYDVSQSDEVCSFTMYLKYVMTDEDLTEIAGE